MPRTELRSNIRSQGGFTLVELIIVMVIIAALVTIAAINMAEYQRRSRLREAARLIETDLNTIRTTARIRQESNIVLLLGADNYRAFVDGNSNLVSDPTDSLILQTMFNKGEQLAIGSNGPAIPPVTTVQFLNTGGLRDANRDITVTVPNEAMRRYRITLFTTGITRVERTDDGGASWNKAW